MRLHDLGPDSVYRYLVDLLGPVSRDHLYSMRSWAEDLGMPCTIFHSVAFFKTHQDAMVFLLAFSR